VRSAIASGDQFTAGPGYEGKLSMIPVEESASSRGTILAVEDDETSRRVVVGYLKRFGYTVSAASNGVQALELLGRQDFDLIISDLRMPEMGGIELLDAIRSRGNSTPFIIVTACGSVDSAVDAMRRGACDYLEKPINIDNLQLTVERTLTHQRVVSENCQIKAYLKERFTFQNIITVCPAMKYTLELASKVASSPKTTVAIFGESGTGKEVLARAIHYESGGLPGNFVAVNCAAIPESLLESELFGHVRGAFTGADREREGKFSLARGGTLFLDEVGDMPLALQAKLLRVLEERSFEKVGSNVCHSVDFRVIVATHRDLSQMVQQGRFREDLYHRIHVVPLSIPPLRERIDDIPLLIEHFLGLFRQHQGKALPGVSKKAIDHMTSYHWPGNIRELRNMLEYAAIMVSDELIRPEHLRMVDAAAVNPAPHDNGYNLHINLADKEISLEAITDQILQKALGYCDGNKSKAASLLKVDRKRFYR
jgi:DNA-binding NtrC family response regulator